VTRSATGLPFTINIRVVDRSLCISGNSSCASNLERVAPQYRRQGGIFIPDDGERPMHPVPDEISGTWINNMVNFHKHPRLLAPWRCHDVRPHGVVLLVESPHRDEFDEETREARGPLCQKQTRRNLHCHLSRLISDATVSIPQNADVVIANPVQFQASLVDFMVERSMGKARRLRDDVWKAFFAHEVIRTDFARRMRNYRPALVIIAPSYRLQEPVADGVRALSLESSCLVKTIHPSWWHRRAPAVRKPSPLSPPGRRRAPD